MAKVADKVLPQNAEKLAEEGAKDLALTGNRDVAVYDYSDDEGSGMEDIKKEERRLPFVRILDSKSPQTRPVAQGGIAGARGGTIFNTSTLQVFDGEVGLDFLPTSRDYKFVEYIKRNDDGSGGGFVAVHEPDEPEVLQLIAQYATADGKIFRKLPMGIDVDGKEHELVQTFYLYGIFIVPETNYEEMFRGVIGFASTQIKKYTSLIDRLDGMSWLAADGKRKKFPLYAHRLHLTTVYEAKGVNSWYGWTITMAEKNPDGSEAPAVKSRLSAKDPLFLLGREFNQVVTTGEAKADFKAQEGGTTDDRNDVGGQSHNGGGGANRQRQPGEEDENIPF